MGSFTLSIVSKLQVKEVKTQNDTGKSKTTTSNTFSCQVPKSESDTSVLYFVLDNGTELSVTLMKYALHKQVYAPCRLDISLQASGSASVGICKQLIANLDKADVKLVYTGDDSKQQSVADNYYVYQVNPRFITQDSTQSLIIDLVAYSKDHLLTLENGSQAFTAQKFISEIFQGDSEKICANHGVVIDKSTHSQCLTLISEESNKKTTKPKETEVIQPYLVQYDEPYYNFLARTANRCGELMYFENGKLCIGLNWLPGSYESIPVSTPKGISFVNLSKVSPQFTSIYPDTVNDSTSVGKYASALSVMDDVATDEYIFKIKKGEWTSFAKEYAGNVEKKLMGLIPRILQKEGLADMITKISLEESMSMIEASLSEKSVNSGNDESYFKPTKIEQRGTDSSDTSKTSDTSETTDSSKTTDSSNSDGLNVAYPFTSYFKSKSRPFIDIPYLTTHEFYSKILKYEREVSSQALEIDFGTSYNHILLGSVISLDNALYLVTDIKADVELGNATIQQYSLTAIPLISIIEKGSNNSTTNHTFAFPPLYSGGHVRKSGVQRAFIYESKDPLKLGRVRIRYPWQKKLENLKTSPINDGEDKDQNRVSSSPWIRFSSDYTVNDGGICFQPDKGTEVLIDYENGNVEHPYVVGSLYNANTSAYKDDSVQSITSKNGHSIRFKDPKDGGKFITGLWSGWDLLCRIIPPLKDASKDKLKILNNLTGGIELKDYYGLYNISMSSDKRSIKIDSPFGTVGINAFSGISINAPNGDVKIVGKNVSITANNNLTLTSGNNIKKRFDQRTWLAETANEKKEIIKNDLRNLGKTAFQTFAKAKLIKPMIDLKFLRDITEAILKPVEGTLKIKSFRYLMLEAGKGSSQIPASAYKDLNISKDLYKYHKIIEDIDKVAGQAFARPSELMRIYERGHACRVRLANYMKDHSYVNDQSDVKLDQKTVDDKLDVALETANKNPDLGGHKEDYERTTASAMWKELYAALEDFNKFESKYSVMNCTNINRQKLFSSDATVISNNPRIEYVQKEVKKFIENSGVVKGDATKPTWNEYVDSINATEKTEASIWLEYFKDQLWDSFLGVTWAEDVKKIYPYVWSKNSSGEILFSNDKAHTLSFDRGALKNEDNLTIEAIIDSIKMKLRGYKNI